jgi:hypothetical protein
MAAVVVYPTEVPYKFVYWQIKQSQTCFLPVNKIYWILNVKEYQHESQMESQIIT